ncbi:hypothetical protein K504DRAFT_456554 [Pleomassaria siparia CBS 279.74]|uniref:Uncharacterized protein n=1 Tax=Pleomassaria siparia CBS 279.74 TaxID=1314801 RepID=A0A6G1KND6_9PLEO|nr:hypothetical protein K504DRAFT_456554 [Pleomassaria siparia CBS 279.74]
MSIPILFTLPPSNRHEAILLDTTKAGGPTLKSINKQVTAAMGTSPNCAEFMSKYKKTAETRETIESMRIHWAETGRDRNVWPEYTELTNENLPAIIELLRLAPGKGDVLEIKVGKAEAVGE